jgi:putative membrane protein
MKTILKSLFVNAIILYIAAMIYPGIVYDNTLSTLVLAAVTLTILNRFIKPILKLLLLPINLITLGVFRWVISVVSLFLLTTLIDGYSVIPYQFAGLTYEGFVAPSMYFNILFSYILASITISFTTSVVRWLL